MAVGYLNHQCSVDESKISGGSAGNKEAWIPLTDSIRLEQEKHIPGVSGFDHVVVVHSSCLQQMDSGPSSMVPELGMLDLLHF